jgi:hypothetical protein
VPNHHHEEADRLMVILPQTAALPVDLFGSQS